LVANALTINHILEKKKLNLGITHCVLPLFLFYWNYVVEAISLVTMWEGEISILAPNGD